MTTTDHAAVEVLLEDGTIATKTVTPRRTYTHAIVTDSEVVPWHTDCVAAQRAWYRKATHADGPLRIVRTRMV